MDKRDFTVLGLRLLAIYAWLEACTYLIGGSFRIFFYQDGKLTLAIVLASFLPPMLLLAIGFVLFRFSQRIAEYLLPGLSSDDSQIVSGSQNLAVIAFGATGLIAFFMALPRTVQLLIRWSYVLKGNMPVDITETFQNDLGNIVGTALQFVLGFALIIRTRKFTEWWWHRQNLQP
jgi:hypothetical protein